MIRQAVLFCARGAVAVMAVASCGERSPTVPVATASPAATTTTTTIAPAVTPIDDPRERTVAATSTTEPMARAAAEDIEVEVGGVVRTAHVTRPPSLPPGSPVVLVLHGRGGTGRSMLGTAMHEPANAAGAVVVLPDALGASWNDDRPGLQPPVPADDVAFLDTLIDHVVRTDGVDGRRVVVAGFSNGGLMTSRYACERSARVAAAVIVGAAGPQGIADRCRPDRAVPVLVVSGTADEVVPYAGGPVAGIGRGTVASAAEVLAHWSRVNGCDTLDVEATRPGIEVVRGAGCDDGSTVEHHRVLGGTHVWLREAGFDTTSVAWTFARRFLHFDAN